MTQIPLAKPILPSGVFTIILGSANSTQSCLLETNLPIYSPLTVITDTNSSGGDDLLKTLGSALYIVDGDDSNNPIALVDKHGGTPSFLDTKLLVGINGKTNGLGYPYFRIRPYIPINQGLQPGDD